MTAANEKSFFGMLRMKVAVVVLTALVCGFSNQSVQAGCGSEHHRPMRSDQFSGWKQSPNEIKLELWVAYSGGTFSVTTTAPSKPCDGAGCGSKEQMAPEPPLTLSVRTHLTVVYSSPSQCFGRDLFNARMSRYESMGSASPGFLFVIEHPPKLS